MTAIKITKDANNTDVMLVGTETGKIKIYGLPHNDKKGMVMAHDKVVGILAWDRECFVTAGTEGRIHIWLWKATPAGAMPVPAPMPGVYRPPGMPPGPSMGAGMPGPPMPY